MNPFDINRIGGSMDKAPKKKPSARRSGPAHYVTIRGKRIKTTARGARIFRLAKKALKGIEVPPR